jgi:Flp pilus assembly protein TadG
MNTMITSRITTTLCRFQLRQDGGVAIIFALSMLPIITMAGASVDYTRASKERAALQQATDAAALSGGKIALVDVNKGIEEAKKVFQSNLTENMGYYVPVVTYDQGTKTLNVKSSGAISTTFMGIMNVNAISVNSESSSQISEKTVITTKNPVAAFLDSEAGDYNRIYVYCFNESRKYMADSGRSQMTPLMDNAGTKYNTNIPECRDNESISFRLFNVRNSRTNPSVWDSAPQRTLLQGGYNDLSEVRYDYYTDTVVSNNVMTHHFPNNIPILETKICNSLSECKSTTQGGIIQQGKNRSPVMDMSACTEDKYIYFGWEDRPPGYGWTDSDFDDITYVIECPKKIISKISSAVRIVK